MHICYWYHLNIILFQIETAFSKYDVTGDDMLNYKEFCGMINNKND